jgi:N-acetylmuramoyl-L-alanine amidase
MARTVLVSAGHSTVPPRDPGACADGHREADLAVDLRDRVAPFLRGLGVRVTTDGEDGQSEPLRKAIQLARAADVAVEIHWNASNGAGHGIEVLAKPHQKPLAKDLAKAIHNATGLTLRGDGGWKSDGSGHHKRLGFCEAGGLIIEVCFVDNEADMKAYLANRAAVAKNLAVVLQQYAARSEAASGSTGAVAKGKSRGGGRGYPHRLLRRGSYESAVGDVQRKLRALGYPVSVDDDFGPGTDEAVRKFQRKAGLDVDGAVGRDTWRALFG